MVISHKTKTEQKQIKSNCKVKNKKQQKTQKTKAQNKN